MSLPVLPTSIFTSGDTCAIGVFEALAEDDIRVPEEMAIVGFDDLKFAPFLRVPLTSVHQPLEEMGATAVALLLGELKNKRNRTRTITLDAELIIRESCGHARVAADQAKKRNSC
jgi:LacI family repressor for deo operon, udp, cdd, tsx, nupC, and nupG